MTDAGENIIYKLAGSCRFDFFPLSTIWLAKFYKCFHDGRQRSRRVRQGGIGKKTCPTRDFPRFVPSNFPCRLTFYYACFLMCTFPELNNFGVQQDNARLHIYETLRHKLVRIDQDRSSCESEEEKLLNEMMLRLPKRRGILQREN